MSKLADILFGVAIAIALLMMSVCLMLLPDNPPPEWVGYAAIVAVGVCAGTASFLMLYCSVTSYNRSK